MDLDGALRDPRTARAARKLLKRLRRRRDLFAFSDVSIPNRTPIDDALNRLTHVLFGNKHRVSTKADRLILEFGWGRCSCTALVGSRGDISHRGTMDHVVCLLCQQNLPGSRR
jgi:hypothetical protein